MAAWPTYAVIIWNDLSVTLGKTVRRTELDSGEIAQKQRLTRTPITRQATVSVPDSQKANWDTWIEEHGANYNDVPDSWTKSTLSLRIRGGQVTMQPASDRRDGKRHWVGRITLEGFK